ncbi:MarR family transcriptional regulator [Methanococcoides sp. SA1]|nr:MarR family transcriptional regulator [Methanococcoides sp. SA1]
MKVLKELKNPKTPTQVSKLLDIKGPSASRCILGLEKRGFLVCLTPDEKMGRLYKTTEFGEKVLSKIENESMESIK